MKDGKKSGDKLEKLVEQIEGLTVLELSGLVTSLQEKLGVSPLVASQQTGQAAIPTEEAANQTGAQQSSGAAVQTVVLTDSGPNKISVIKALREINPNLGLKEAKDMTESTPKEVLVDAKADEVKTAKEKLEAAGAKVELK